MEGIEIERKYIIEKPSWGKIALADGYTESHITQIYLNSDPGITHRIRKRCYSDGRVEYTETRKIRIDKISSIEDEREISKEEFLSLASNLRHGSAPLEKIRRTFSYLGNVIEIDEYPEWQRTCIMETELGERDECVELPDFIRIVKEVTGEKQYSNSSMSNRFPDELE